MECLFRENKINFLIDGATDPQDTPTVKLVYVSRPLYLGGSVFLKCIYLACKNREILHCINEVLTIYDWKRYHETILKQFIP